MPVSLLSGDPEARVRAFFPSGPPPRLGVAVSGGGDSIALLLLLRKLYGPDHKGLACVTVDHGLRAGAAEEADGVARLCHRFNIPHDILRWSDWDGNGNTQAAARDARYRLMADWASGAGIGHVALGHTRDDQAETVLMRLARASGVDGLSAMAPRRGQYGVTWLRPLLQTGRDSLRRFLRAEGVDWVDDPSNEDSRFDRIRVRKSMDALEDIGITSSVLARVAENMAVAREALTAQTAAAAASVVSLHAGAVRIDGEGYDKLPAEIARRLMLSALVWINGAVYAPRGRSVEAALAALKSGGSATLDGCHMRLSKGGIWIFREYDRVKSLEAPVGALWDNRWRVCGKGAGDACVVTALGPEGLSLFPDWRALEIPRDALLSTPAVRRAGVLIAAPVVQKSPEWQANPENREMSFF